MIDLSTTCSHLDHYIRLNTDFHSDLVWWHLFLVKWNGISCLESHIKRPADITVFTDASGQWGCGAVENPYWFQYPWSTEWQGFAIAVKEMLPIVLAMWGSRWSKRHVLVRCNNMSVVHILHSQTSKDATIMHLVRSLHFFLAYWDIRLWAEHVPGKENILADALSRNMLQVIQQHLPSANPTGEEIPQALKELLVSQRPDWTSQVWRDKFAALLNLA